MQERPSKKQRELLLFIDGFIKGNGYGPSYREIMRALDYKSVSTVAVHIDGLITKGKLIKNGRSARSLEVVDGATEHKTSSAEQQNVHLAWLRQKLHAYEKSGDQQAAGLISKTIELLDQTEDRR